MLYFVLELYNYLSYTVCESKCFINITVLFAKMEVHLNTWRKCKCSNMIICLFLSSSSRSLVIRQYFPCKSRECWNDFRDISEINCLIWNYIPYFQFRTLRTVFPSHVFYRISDLLIHNIHDATNKVKVIAPINQ